MPKIPNIQEQSVQMSQPTVQQYKIPGAIPGAFGELSAEALGDAGKSLSDLSSKGFDVAAMVNKQKLDEEKATTKNEYALNVQNLMFNEEEETYKDSKGIERSRPKGYQLRSQYQTEGSVESWIQSEFEMRQSLLENYSGDKKALNLELENLSVTARERILQHQVTEGRKAAHNTYGKTRKTYIDQAAMATDSKSLVGFFENLASNNMDEANRFGMGEEEIASQNNADFKGATDNATTGILINSGDLEKAKTLLSEVQEYLLPDSYNEIAKKLDTMSEAIKKRFDAQKKISYNKNTVDLANMLVDKSLTPEIVRKMQEEDSIPSDTAAIFYSLSLDKVYEIPESTPLGEPDYFLSKIEDNPEDSEQIHKTMTEATKAYGESKLGVQQYRYFIQKANDVITGKTKKSSFSQKIDSAIKNVKNFFSGNKNSTKQEFAENLDLLLEKSLAGQDPDITARSLIKEYNLKKNPYIISAPENGGVFIDANGNMKLLFPDGDIVDLDGKKPDKDKEKK